jgi:hypothetical protein
MEMVELRVEEWKSGRVQPLQIEEISDRSEPSSVDADVTENGIRFAINSHICED